MEEQNNHLEEFIRKKLNEPSEENSGWDLPSSQVWVNAQQEIIIPSDSSRGLRLGMLIILLLLLTGFTLSHIWQNQRVNDLQKIVDNYQNQLSILTQENQCLENQQEVDQKILTRKNQELTRQNTQLEIEKEALQVQSRTLTKEKNKADELFRLAPKNAKDEAKKKPIADLVEKPSFNISPVKPPIPFSLVSQINSNRPKKTPSFSSATPVLSKPSLKVEIGYQVGLTRLDHFSQKEVKDLKSTSSNLIKERIITPVQGIHLGVSPIKNLFFKTGFQFSGIQTNHNYSTGFLYDKSNEYIKANGKTGNELDLEITTPYARRQNEIEIEIPENTQLESGDILVLSMKESQAIRRYQIPLGIQYHFGQRRWQWYGEIGTRWNQMIFTDYRLETSIEAKATELLIKKSELTQNPANKQFWESYLGLGIKFQLRNRWSIQGQWAYYFPLFKGKLETLPTERTLSLGFNYVFSTSN